MYVGENAISGARIAIKKGTEDILKYKDLIYVESENKIVTNNNWENWNQQKVIQKIHEHHTRKA
jgi:hypothetical protein